MKTLVVQIAGAPGTGKSTLASAVFAALKLQGVSAELVTEYAKEFAHAGKAIDALDQYVLFGEQLRREKSLYGKVQVIVTDSPLFMAVIYQRHYVGKRVLEAAMDHVRLQRLALDVQTYSIILDQLPVYEIAGRFETQDEAAEIQRKINMYAEWELLPGRQPRTRDVDAIVTAITDTLKEEAA